MTAVNSATSPRHDAFMSYSHAADGVLAQALERALERVAKPTFRLRAMDVFRDKSSLSTNPGLWSGILEHLTSSRWFVLLASPHSAASTWCNREVAWWLAQRDVSTLLVVLTDGDIVWDTATGDFDWSKTSALSPALRGRFAEEPLYADLRWVRGLAAPDSRNSRFRDAVIDLAATLRGVPKDQLDGEDVGQLRRTRRLARAGFAAITLVAAVAVWQAMEATAQREQAVQQRDRALSRQLAAQAAELRVQDPRLSLLLAAQALATNPSADASASLLRVLNAAPFERIVEHSEALWSLAVTADETYAIPGDGQNATIRVELATGAVQPLIPAPTDRVSVLAGTLAVAVSPDGGAVAAGGFDQTITLWRNGSIQKIRSGAHEGFIHGLAFRPDGRALASAGSDGRVLLHDLATGTAEKLQDGWTPEMSAVRFSPDGRLLAAGGDAGTVLLFPRRAGPLQGHGSASSVEALEFANDGTQLFCAFFDRSVVVYDVASGNIISRIDGAEHSWIDALAVAPDGTVAFTGHTDGSVIRWNREGESTWQKEILYRHSAGVKGAAFLPASGRLVTIGFDGRLFLTRSAGLPPLTRVVRRFERGFHAAALLPGGNRVVLISEAGWTAEDIESGALLPGGPADEAAAATVQHQKLAHDGGGRSLLLRHDSLVIEPGDSTAAVELRVGDLPRLSAATFSPDGRLLYAVHGDELLAWDTRTGASRDARYRIAAGFTTTLKVSPDGRLLAVARSPAIDFGAAGRRPRADRVTLLRTDDFHVIADALEAIPRDDNSGAGLWGESLFFTPDGGLLGLKSGATITLWSLAELRRLDEPLVVPAFAQLLGFRGHDRRLLLTLPQSRTLLEVDLAPHTWAHEACRIANRNLTREEWALYVSRELEYRPACIDGALSASPRDP